MTDIVVFGSTNLDRTSRVSPATVERLARESDWFPDAGETVTVESPPESFDADATRLGGKGTNQAVAAARATASVSLFGAVGPDADEFGVREQLTAEGVAAGGLATRDTQTGAAYIWVTPDGENRIAIVPGANGIISPDDADRAVETAREANVLLLQNEIPTDAARALLDELADERDIDNSSTGDDRPLVVFDPAPATGARSLVEHPRVDILVPNETEFAALRSSLDDARGRGATVVRTDGPDGAAVFDSDEETESADSLDTPSFLVETPEASVVDTTGAGDAFVGYLAAELADDGSLRAAVERGVRAGTRACEREGAMTAPRSEELRGRWD